MKSIKFSLLAASAMVLAAFSNTVKAASDAELMPYVHAAAQEYLEPYLSRDLGKKVKIVDKSSPREQKLELVYPNPTCDDLAFLTFVLGADVYPLEFIADRFEKDKSLTTDDITKPASVFRFFNVAAGLSGLSLRMNPRVPICTDSFKNFNNNPHYVKFLEHMNKNITPRVKRLETEGRFKK